MRNYGKSYAQFIHIFFDTAKLWTFVSGFAVSLQNCGLLSLVLHTSVDRIGYEVNVYKGFQARRVGLITLLTVFKDIFNGTDSKFI